MPQFQLTAPDGRMVTVEGAEPPTESDADDIFAGIPAKAAKPPLTSMEGLFGGVDKIDAWMGPADAGALNASLANSTDAKGAKVRAANVAFMAGQYGLDAGEVAAKLPIFRQNYAKDVLGINEPLDDNAFYAKVGAHITTEKAQGQMLGEMSGALFDAARKGMPFNKTFESFRGANLENAGYVKGRDEYYREVARHQWAFLRTNAIRLSEPIERLSAHMSAFKGESAYFADEAKIAEREDVITMLAALPEQDREMVMDFASGAVSAQSDEQKEQGFGSKLADKTRRGLGSLAEGVTGLVERKTANFMDSLDRSPLERDLGPTEGVVADRQRIERGITQRIVGEVDPLRAGGWLSQGILDAAESMPRMLVSLSAPGIALNLGATKQEIQGRYEDQGLSPSDASTLSSIAAVPYVALDFVSAKMAFKGRLPGLERLLTAPVASAGRLAGRAALVGAAGTVEQFGQEVLQDLTEPAIQSVASALSESIPEVNWTEQLSFLKASAPETLAAILPLVLIGTGSATFKDRAYGREYLKNFDALRAVGFSEEVANEIIEAPTPEQAGAIMRQGWGERETGAEQQAFVQSLNKRAIEQREEMGYVFSEAQKALLEKYPNEFNSIPPNQIPVEIKKADGTVYPAVMSGYYELGPGDFRASIGRFVDGGWSHGMARPEETTLSELPTPEQWAKGIRDISDTKENAAPEAESAVKRQLEQVQQQPAPQATEEAAPAVEPVPVVTKVPEVGYVVTDKNTGQPLGSAPTAEGAAQIVQDVKADQADLVALNKAAIGEVRDRLGMDELDAPDTKKMETSFRNAKAQKLDERAEQLAAVLEVQPRTISDEEHAGMVLREAQLQNQLEKTEKDAMKAFSEGNEAKGEELVQSAKDIETKIETLTRASDLVGTELGRALNIRKLQLRRDYSLARMVVRREMANQGKLSEEQRAETEQFQKKIAALEAELNEAKTRLSEEQAGKPTRERKAKPPKPREPGKVMAFLSKQAAEARMRLKERLNNVNSGVDPTIIADLAIVGAEYVAKGVRDFSKWSAAMVKEFGDRLTPFLGEIYDRAKEIKKLQDIEARADARIAELERQIRDEEVGTPTPSDLTSPEIEAKRAKIAELEEQRENVRDLYRPEPSTPDETKTEKEAARLDREIERIEKQISSGIVGTAARKEGEKTPENKGKRRLLEVLKFKRQNMRDELQANDKEAPEVTRLRSFNKRTEEAITELERRLEDNDFSEKPPRTPLELDDRALKIQAELELLKIEYDNKLREDKYKRLGPLGKVLTNAAATYDVFRNLMSTGEFSFIGRQGLFTALEHPLLAAQAIPDTIEALLSGKVDAHKVNLRVLEHPDAVYAKRAKLHLLSEGDSLTKQEETMVGRWASKVPILKNFNQAATVFLNRIRFDSFRAMREDGPTNAKLDKEIANYINVATGRGQGLGNAAVFLGRTLYAPAFLVSRFQYAVGYPLWGTSPEGRARIAKSYAKTLLSLSAYYGLLYLGLSGLAGDDDEKKPTIGLDPRRSDFLKLTYGDRTVDPLAGLSQAIVFMSRNAVQLANSVAPDADLPAAFVTRSGGERSLTAADEVFFLRTKLHPTINGIINGLTGKDIFNKPTDWAEQGQTLITPITWNEIYKDLRANGASDEQALWLLAIMGIGVQNQDRK